LPRSEGLQRTVQAGSNSTMAIAVDSFSNH
jgi:hypothetical protein